MQGKEEITKMKGSSMNYDTKSWLECVYTTMNIGNVQDCHNKIASGNLPSDSVLKFPDIPSSLDPFWPLEKLTPFKN